MSRVVLLREWSSVVDAIGRGAVVLIRKGGISEGTGGFAVEAGRFVLWPTLFHERAGLSHERAGSSGPGPQFRTLHVGCELVKWAEVSSDADLSGLSGLHGYGQAQLRVRASYRPERPLTLMVVRPVRLVPPLELASSALPAACRSWAVLEGWPTERSGGPGGEPEAWWGRGVPIDVGDAVERALSVVERLGREVAYARA